MKIELNKTKCIRPFENITPATCFIPDIGSVKGPDNLNVWIKLQAQHRTAVNLATGELRLIGPEVQCEPVDAKVVIE